MPDSGSFVENKPVRNVKNRHEFSPATKKNLAMAAGHKCSIYRCLRSSSCITTNEKGIVENANLGMASHIYAAAPGGPRPPPPEMTPKQISDHSNGIWTCRDCGTAIDTFICDYTAAQLFDMKKVRETAQKMATNDRLISVLSGYITPLEFDDVFWAHLPDLDTEKVRLALIETGGNALLDFHNKPSQRISMPTHLALKPSAHVVKAVTEKAMVERIPERSVVTMQVASKCASPSDQFTQTRRRALEIVQAWAKDIPQGSSSRVGWHYHRVNVKLTARDPQTGSVLDACMWVIADGLGLHGYTAREGEVLHLRISNTCSRASSLDWRLIVAVEKGTQRAISTLRLTGRAVPGDLLNDQEWASFEAYEQVIRKLADGWHPIGFISMKASECSSASDVHPEPFEIVVKYSQTELDDYLYRCSKVRLAREISMKWGRWFMCNEIYFERALDSTLIWTASEELRTRLGPPPYWHEGESSVMLVRGGQEVKLIYKNQIIYVVSVATRL